MAATMGKLLAANSETGNRAQLSHLASGHIGSAELRDVPAMLVTKAPWDKPIERPAKRILSLKHLLRCVVEQDDLALSVDGDDGIHGRLDDAFQPEPAD